MELPIWKANLFFSIFYLTIAHPTLPVFYFESDANSLLHFKLCGLKKKKRAENANAQRGD